MATAWTARLLLLGLLLRPKNGAPAVTPERRALKGTYDFHPKDHWKRPATPDRHPWANMEELQRTVRGGGHGVAERKRSLKDSCAWYGGCCTQAVNPWPQEEAAVDNLCALVQARKLTVTIVMGSDLGYHQHVERCTKKGEDPVAINAKFADKYGYSLRFYIDEEVPFIMRHGKNAMMGELRKIYALADSMRPSGPQHGTWRTTLQTIRPDLVMWVDGDAHIVGKFQNNPLTIEQVVRRACERADMPPSFARIIAQDSGSNVNAGWYIISARSFGIHFLHYLTELFEVYGPCKMWGQHLIQEALLVLMAGTPPPWPLVLPCSGEMFYCLTNKTLAPILHECHGSKDCVLTKAAALTNATRFGSLATSAAALNTCFGKTKMIMAPNAEAMVERAYAAIAAQGPGCVPQPERPCCFGYNTYDTPACNGGANHSDGRWWTASGAGVVLLPEGDDYVTFNRLKLHTNFLWHHGHGRLISGACP
jgi:hypothetical protein